VESSYAIAFVNRGHRALEKGDPLAAIESYRAALRRDVVSEPALAAISYGFQVADSVESALRWADRARRVRPRSGQLATSYARALWRRPPARRGRAQLSGSGKRIEERYMSTSSSDGCTGSWGARTARRRLRTALRPERCAARGTRARSRRRPGRRWEEAWRLYERSAPDQE
jgi:hypothetical protein